MEKPLIIGICGGSGSGKTSFIRDLVKKFPAEKITLISQDDYYFPRDTQKKDKNGVINFDLPTAIDKIGFQMDIEKLISGGVVVRNEYTFNNEQKKPSLLTFKPNPIIIVEGLFIFHFKRIRKLLDIKVFLDAKENLKVVRRIKRDRIERNYPLDDVLYRYENHVLPAFEKYILPHRPKADIIINNNKNYTNGLAILNGYLQYYLKNKTS